MRAHVSGRGSAPHRPASLLIVGLVAIITLAGCVGSDADAPTSTTQEDAAADPPATYVVPIKVAHNVNAGSRTLEVRVLQGGVLLDSGSFTTADQAPTDEVVLLEVTVEAGDLAVEVYEGGAPVGFKSIGPDRCTAPDVTVHATDDQVHVWSSCD